MKIINKIFNKKVETVKDLKIVSIGEVFDCVEFIDENEKLVDILISCKMNATYEEYMEFEDYMSDGAIFISVFANIENNECTIELCDCYKNMYYTFTKQQLKKIKTIARNYIKENYSHII